jgi:hypothetical protein
MSKLYNLARMTTATTGTGTITLGVAVSGYLTFANAGVQNADVLLYGINDGAASEVGWGTYTASGTTLTRNVIKSTNSNAAINLDGSAQVYVTALAGDGGDLLPSFDHPMRGFDTAINLQLNASVASNILTVAVKGNNGNDPSTSNPVLVAFRDATAANGDPVWIAITSALSINTNATGASLGSANGVAFRLWVVLFNNGGTPVLGLWQSVNGGSSPVAIYTLSEGAPASSTAISGSATTPGTFYTPNGTTVTNCSFRILGYLEYSGGLTIAGTYASAPSRVQLFGPGIKKPGDVVSIAYGATSTSTSVSSSTKTQTNLSCVIAPTSTPNLVMVDASGSVTCATSSGIAAQLSRGTGPTLFGTCSTVNTNVSTNVAASIPCALAGVDAPGTTSATTYSVYVWVYIGGSASSWLGQTGASSSIRAQEIMT